MLNSSFDSSKSKFCKKKKTNNTKFFVNGKSLNALNDNFQLNAPTLIPESTNLPFNLPITIDTHSSYNCVNNTNKVNKRSRKQSLTLTPSPNISTSFCPFYSIESSSRMQYHHSSPSHLKNSKRTGTSIKNYHNNYSFW